MKLHLPKALLLAVLAVSGVAQMSQAAVGWHVDGFTNHHIFYYDGTESGATVAEIVAPTSDNGVSISGNPTAADAYTNLYMCVDVAGAVERTVNKLVLADGQNLTIRSNPWKDYEGTVAYYDLLDIDKLEIGAGTGSGGLNLAQAESVVNIDTVSGILSGVTNSGNLTIGSEGATTTLGGTITNNGTLSLKGNYVVNDLSGFNAIYDSGAKTATTNGIYETGLKYTIYTGNALTDGSTSTFTYNGNTYNFTDTISEGTTKEYAVVDSTTTAILGGTSESEGISEADKIVVNGGNLSIAEGTYDYNSGYIEYISGTMSLESNATISVTESTNISSFLKNTGGTGTFDLQSGTTTLIAGGTSGAEVYDFAGKIKVNSGATLNLGDSGDGGNSLWSVDLTAADIVMNGGTIRYFGGNSSLGDVLVQANSTLTVYASCNGSTIGTLNIAKASVDSGKQLTLTNTWESYVDIDVLELNGTLLMEQSDYINDLKIGSLSGSGMLQGLKGNITLEAGNHTIDRLDASKGGNSTTVFTLKSGAHLTVASNMWKSTNGQILLEDTASLTRDKLTVIGTANAADVTSSITREDVSGGDAYNLGNASYVISNADVKVNATEATTLGNKLVNSTIINDTTHELTLTNSGNVLRSIKANNGNINILNSTLAQTLESVYIGSNVTLGVYTGDSIPTTPSSDNEKQITTSYLSAGVGSTLNATLSLQNGATVNLDGTLNMGSNLLLGSNLTLTGSLYDSILNMQENDIVTLFSGVDYLYGSELGAYGGDSYYATLDPDSILLGDVFTNVNFENIYLGYNGSDVYATMLNIPEPATASLSLLGLAALIMRRRRA